MSVSFLHCLHTCSPSPCPTHARRVQAADPEDPWLQYEWGATLLALGGPSTSTTQLKEASVHLDVAAAIFAKASQDMQLAGGRGQGNSASSGSTKGGPRLLHLTQLDGKTPLSPLAALQAALRPLELLRGAWARGGGAVQSCDVLQRLCHLKLMLLQYLQQQAMAASASASVSVSEDGRDRLLQDATAAGQACMSELNGLPKCQRQAETLRSMVRMH